MADGRYDSIYVGAQIDEGLRRALEFYGTAKSIAANGTDDDLDAMLNSVLSGMATNEIKYIALTNSSSSTKLPNGYWLLHIDHFTSGYAVVTAVSRYSSSYKVLVRRYVGGVWQPWEWQEGMPMALGVEYRTTERYQAQPVYTMLVNFGAMPNTTTKDVTFGDDTCKAFFVSAVGVLTDGSVYTFPISSNAYVWAQDNSIRIQTNLNYSSYTGRVLVKYTKTTD